MLLNRIAKYGTLIYATLIFVGYLHLHVYYSMFRLPIYSFLNLSEIVVQFFPDLIEIFIISLIVVLFFGFHDPDPQLNKTKPYFINKILNEIWSYNGKRSLITIIKLVFSFLFRVFLALIFVTLLLFPFFIIGYYISFLFPYRGGDNHENVVVFIYAFGLIVIMILLASQRKIFNRIESNFEIGLSRIEKSFVIIFFIYLTVGSILKIYESEIISNGEPFYNATFIYKNDTISSDTSTVFIGQTNNYLFLRDLEKKKNLIFEKSNISSLELSIYSREKTQNDQKSDNQTNKTEKLDEQNISKQENNLNDKNNSLMDNIWFIILLSLISGSFGGFIFSILLKKLEWRRDERKEKTDKEETRNKSIIQIASQIVTNLKDGINSKEAKKFENADSLLNQLDSDKTANNQFFTKEMNDAINEFIELTVFYNNYMTKYFKSSPWSHEEVVEYEKHKDLVLKDDILTKSLNEMKKLFPY